MSTYAERQRKALANMHEGRAYLEATRPQRPPRPCIVCGRQAERPGYDAGDWVCSSTCANKKQGMKDRGEI